MTLEINSPELEALIRQRMQAGSFKNAEDVIREALSPSTTGPTGAALIEAMRSCPYPDVEIAPERIPSSLVQDVSF